METPQRARETGHNHGEHNLDVFGDTTAIPTVDCDKGHGIAREKERERMSFSRSSSETQTSIISIAFTSGHLIEVGAFRR